MKYILWEVGYIYIYCYLSMLEKPKDWQSLDRTQYEMTAPWFIIPPLAQTRYRALVAQVAYLADLPLHVEMSDGEQQTSKEDSQPHPQGNHHQQSCNKRATVTTNALTSLLMLWRYY